MVQELMKINKIEKLKQLIRTCSIDVIVIRLFYYVITQSTIFLKRLVLNSKRENYRKKNYILSHITVFPVGNAGDNVLSECIRKLFHDFFGDISWNLIYLHNPVTDDYIQRLNKTRAVIVGGHGVFLPDTNPNDISGWGWPCAKERYTEINRPLIVFGVGYNYFHGQIRSRLFEENVGALLEASSFFGLRNRGSIYELREFVDSDVANKLVFQPCPTMVARYLYPDLPPKRRTKKIAFNVALDRADMRMRGNDKVILDNIAQAMCELYKKGYEIHFIVHCDIELEFIEYIRRYKFKYYFHHASVWSAKKLIGFYNNMDVVIGMRGHGIWIPFGVNCHIISLGNQNKTKWFLEDINALDWYIDINANAASLADVIIQKFIDIHENNCDLTTDRLLKAQAELWEITTVNMQRIRELMPYDIGCEI